MRLPTEGLIVKIRLQCDGSQYYFLLYALLGKKMYMRKVGYLIYH